MVAQTLNKFQISDAMKMKKLKIYKALHKLKQLQFKQILNSSFFSLFGSF